MYRERNQLKERRKELGLSRRKLAEMVGITPTALVKYERGERTPRPAVAVRIAQNLDVSAAIIFPDLVRRYEMLVGKHTGQSAAG